MAATVEPRLMLDPSVFLAEETLAFVRDELERSGEVAYVSARFLEVARSSISYEEGVGAFFGQGGDETAGGLFRDWAAQTDCLVGYEPTEAEIEQAGEVATALRDLPGLDADVREILVQEWVYLKTHSWLGARIDRATKVFEKAGAVVADFGKDAIDLAVSTGEAVSRVITAKRLKWVAVGALGSVALAAILATHPLGLAGIALVVVADRGGHVAEELARNALLRIDP